MEKEGGKERGKEGGREKEGGKEGGREGERVDREEEEEKELLTIIPYNNSPVVPSFWLEPHGRAEDPVKV